MLSPANEPVVNSTGLQLSPDVPVLNVPVNTATVTLTGRVLPTARELAECHGEDELRRLRGVATGLNDQEAVKLFEAAQTERRRIEVEQALARPAEWRRHQAEKEEIHRQYNANKATLGGLLAMQPAVYGIARGTPEAYPASSGGQSAGPSE